ncbi:MAG: hypothetical protein K2O09_08865 [Treponemataceae bacterium]|nr:hypothetical protein [Treponemataceae bacterium]
MKHDCTNALTGRSSLTIWRTVAVDGRPHSAAPFSVRNVTERDNLSIITPPHIL